MQTEMRMRLLIHDKDRQSGYKVVGYMYIEKPRKKVNELRFWSENIGNSVFKETYQPSFTAIEQGTKLEGTWYYDGDRVEHKIHGAGTVVYNSGYVQAWSIKFDNKEIPAPMLLLPDCEVIGTIHDKDEDSNG